MSITENYKRPRAEIPDHVTIVAAAKTRNAAEVRELIDAGAAHIGHNYLQEAEAMYEALGDYASKVSWHFIGDLQKNKINRALKICDIIETVDSVKKAEALNIRAERIGKKIDVLIEVNSGGEQSKSGAEPCIVEIKQIAEKISLLPFLKLQGLMTMGPLTGNDEDLRGAFRSVKGFYDTINGMHFLEAPLRLLSMGMSDSYKMAIEEGANIVRLGTIIFGKRG